MAISASGNSTNFITVATWIKERDGVVMSLVGFDGGELKDSLGRGYPCKIIKG